MRRATWAFVMGGALVALGGCGETTRPAPDPAARAGAEGAPAITATAEAERLAAQATTDRSGAQADAEKAGKEAAATPEKAGKEAAATPEKAGEKAAATPEKAGERAAASADKGERVAAVADKAAADSGDKGVAAVDKGAQEAGAISGDADRAVAAPKPPPEPATPPGKVAAAPPGGDARFSVWMQGGGKHKVGEPGQVEVVLVPRGEFHCNDQYPYKVKLNAPPPGITFPEPVVKRGSMAVSPTRTVARVPFVASTPGDMRISGRFSFSVCTDSQCVIESRDVSAVVKVE